MSDVVEIRGLRVMGTHGVLDEERQRAQPFEVDIDVETDLAPAGRSDELATDRTPRPILALAHELEAAAARVRKERWGPRTLDVDVLLVGDLTVNDPDLVVPHPRMFERAFVLIPLSDLAPEVVPGGRPSDPGVRLLFGFEAL